MLATNSQCCETPAPRRRRRPEPCQARRRGVVCHGDVYGTGNYRPVVDPATLLADHSLKERKWTCSRCGASEWEVVFTRKMDPDNRQPMISEATQRLSRDPYAGL